MALGDPGALYTAEEHPLLPSQTAALLELQRKSPTGVINLSPQLFEEYATGKSRPYTLVVVAGGRGAGALCVWPVCVYWLCWCVCVRGARCAFRPPAQTRTRQRQAERGLSLFGALEAVLRCWQFLKQQYSRRAVLRNITS